MNDELYRYYVIDRVHRGLREAWQEDLAARYAAERLSPEERMVRRFEEACRRQTPAMHPLEKIVLGAAFYSRKWTGVCPDHHGLLQNAESIGGYGPSYGELLEKYIGRNGFVRYWDDHAKAPYLFDGSTFITFDDADSIAQKCAYIKEKGLLGLMYWEHSCDPSGALLKAIADIL